MKSKAKMLEIAKVVKDELAKRGVIKKLAVDDFEINACCGWDYFEKKGWSKTEKVLDEVAEMIEKKYNVRFSPCAFADGPGIVYI